MVFTHFELGSSFGMVEVKNGEWADIGMVDVPYRSLVGSLMFLAVCTRPDLAMAVSSLSRYCDYPQVPKSSIGALGGSKEGAAVHQGDGWGGVGVSNQPCNAGRSVFSNAKEGDGDSSY